MKTPIKRWAFSLVELLRRYSNHGDQVERLTRLLDLPVSNGSEPILPTVRTIRHLTSEEETELIQRYQLGDTVRQLARHYGMDRGSVSNLLKRERVRVRYHQTTDVDLARADELQRQGLNLTDVAALLGVGRTTLVRARRAAR